MVWNNMPFIFLQNYFSWNDIFLIIILAYYIKSTYAYLYKIYAMVLISHR